MKKWFKRIIIFIVLCGILCVTALFYADKKIVSSTQNFVYDNVADIPSQNVALVLGTSKKLRGGANNPYFTNRMIAAKELYDAGKVKAFVVSGDNSTSDYDEPTDMREALVELGIPDSIIYLDYAGFRTLDSVVRMGEVFGQTDYIIVSQKFHNERAVFLARYYGHNAYGYNATDLKFNRFSSRTVFREKLARVKVFVDLLFNKEPKFLGDSVVVE